jgi:acyl-CoA reductase-like NAD-dependent aldehyde dehydrogenase
MSEVVKVLVNGKWTESEERVEIRAPYNQRVVGTTFVADAGMLEAAIAGAVAAFEPMHARPGADRSRILAAVSEGIRRDAEGFARLIALEAGKPLKAARTEVERAVFTFALAAEEASAEFEQHIDVRMPGSLPTRQGTIRWFPVGPVAAITPFNFPLNLVAHKLAPAIAVGCPVVLKPSPQTPLTALKLARLLMDCGLPPGALSVLPMSNEVAASLVADDRLKVLSFTGSAKVGWELKSRSGKKKVLLELGGNAAVIVEPDTDVATAAARCVVGGFGYSGQSCISVQRIFVHEEIFPQFCDALLAGVGKLHSGDPLDEKTDCGPLIREADAVRIEQWINEAVASGAKVLAGGTRNGWFVEPTVLTNTKPDDKVNAEEVFGPVVVLERYSDLSEAVTRVNNSRYGLQAGIFSGDREKLDHAFKHLEVGGVIANDVPTFRSDAMPYGGVKDSGLGREGVRYAMAEMSEMRLLVI